MPEPNYGDAVLELVGFLLIIGAAIVVRRLLSIDRGRWIATLVAVVLGEVGAAFVIREVYGSLSGAPLGAVILAWALVVVFAMFVAVTTELLSRTTGYHRRSGLPHPVRAIRLFGKRVIRYVDVTRIVLRSGLLGSSRRDGELDGARLGRSLRIAMEEAGGLFIKLGQAMAEQPQLVGVAVAHELAMLQDEAAPANLPAARAVIEEELGEGAKAFAEISPTPLGAASLAQTYLARLSDGRVVVVKVQRPGVADDVLCDLDILRRLADRLERRASWARSVGIQELVSGFDERTREELDFRIEAANSAAIKRSLRVSDPIVIPAVFDEFSTARVLVEERAEGRSVGAGDAFDRWDPDRRRQLADGFLTVMVRQMLAGEPFHADPHPGNVFLRPDGALELIDFGAVERLDPYERSGLIDVLRGLQSGEPVTMREGILRIASTARRVDEDALDRQLSRLMSRSVAAEGTLDPAFFEELTSVIREFGIVLPRSTTTLLRTLVTLFGTLDVIAPGYRVLDAAERVGGGVMSEQATPHSVSDVIMALATANASAFKRFPEEVDSLLRHLLRGELRTRVSLLSEPEDVRVASRMLNRLVLAIVGSALALTSGIMVSASGSAALHGVGIVRLLGAIGLFFSVLLLLRVVVQVLRDQP